VIRDIDVAVDASGINDAPAAAPVRGQANPAVECAAVMAIPLQLASPAMRAITVIGSVVVVSLLGAGAVRADEAGSARASAASHVHPASHVHVALGINNPLSWAFGGGFGASLYVGAGEHHAIRANVARYDSHSSTASALLALGNSDGDEVGHSGHTIDVGIGWVYYVERPWSGWTFELGVLRRARDLRTDDENASPEIVATRTTSYAGRAMVGWTWLMSDHVFLAVSTGISAGHESRTESSERYLDTRMVRTHVSRSDAQAEGLLRLGVAWDP
jgi:hypothetical protein